MSSQSSIEEAFDRHKHGAYGRYLRARQLLESAAAGEPIENLAHDYIELEIAAEQAALHLSALVSVLPESELVGKRGQRTYAIEPHMFSDPSLEY